MPRTRLPNLPVLATAATILCGIGLIAWLGLRGSIDVNKLKEWQPLLAALVAVGAATLAYRGAMAKVNLDREIHQTDLERARVKLYVRLEYAARQIHSQAIERIELYRFCPSRKTEPIPIADLRLNAGKELTDAWDNLEAFPLRIVRSLGNLKSAIDAIESIVGDAAPNTTILLPNSPLTKNLLAIKERLEKADEHCRTIIDLLQPVLQARWKQEGGN